MNKSRFFFTIILVSLVLMIIPVTAATQNFSSPGTANASSDAHYFITIDPIGNHTVGNVFFINGTTNLPVTEKLLLYAYPRWEVRGVKRLNYPGIVVEGIPVSAGSNDVHYWSVNVTGGYWIPREFLVNVYLSSSDQNVEARQTFSFFAPEEHITPDPFITIDPIRNHTVGDVFFINGTTNLPVSEKLIGVIQTTTFIPGGKSGVEYPSAILDDIPIISMNSGTNGWSVNGTEVVVKNLPNGWSPYVVVISSKKNSSVFAAQEFILLPATNATPSSNLQTIIQSSSNIRPTTSAATVLSTTQSSSLPIALPIVVLAAIVFLTAINRKKRE